MGVAYKMNKGGLFTFRFTEGQEPKFINAEKLAELDPEGKKPFVVRLMYINQGGKFGPHGVLAGNFGKEELCLDCPVHMTEDIKDWMKDAEVTAQANGGKLGVVAYKYETKNDQRGYSFGLRFVDLV